MGWVNSVQISPKNLLPVVLCVFQVPIDRICIVLVYENYTGPMVLCIG